MGRYDLGVSDAKRDASAAVLNLYKADKDGRQNCGEHAANWVGTAVNSLNKAWDELTDALVRQRDEARRQVIHLIDELAEARKGRP